MNHEFGHLLDFANQLNKIIDCRYEETSPGKWELVGDCKPDPQSWAALSWQTPAKPKPEFDFALRDRVCYYFCGGRFLTLNDAQILFDGLLTSPFLSTYAARHPAEDWAETFALTLAHSTPTFNLELVARNKTYALSEHFQSQLVSVKKDYTKRFLEGPFIYPGE